MRWLLSILPRSASSESVTDDPVAVLKALWVCVRVRVAQTAREESEEQT